MSQQQKKRIYNINGRVTKIKVGTTDNTGTPYANFVLEHDVKEGEKPKKTAVDAYGKAALKVIEGGFAVDGAHIRVGGVYSDEERTNPDTQAKYKFTVLNLLHCEKPKTAEELAALKAAKAARSIIPQVPANATPAAA